MGRRSSAALAAVGFLVVERRERAPDAAARASSRDRTFSAANAMTLLVYAALGAVLFFLVLQLQTVGGYGAARGRRCATLPITLCMLLPRRAGRRARRADRAADPDDGRPAGDGRRARCCCCGSAPDVSYWRDVLPGLRVFGLGLALMVAPLTATVLAAAPDEHAGIASGVNNAVARAGSLLAVAALPVAVGLGGDEYADPVAFDAAYRIGDADLRGAAGRSAALVSWLTIRNPGSWSRGRDPGWPGDSGRRRSAAD